MLYGFLTANCSVFHYLFVTLITPSQKGSNRKGAKQEQGRWSGAWNGFHRERNLINRPLTLEKRQLKWNMLETKNELCREIECRMISLNFSGTISF